MTPDFTDPTVGADATAGADFAAFVAEAGADLAVVALVLKGSRAHDGTA